MPGPASRPRRVLLVVMWIAAVVAVTAAVGMRVRQHRLSDPVQLLRPYLAWMPDDFAEHAVLLGCSRDRNGLSLQVEIRGRPADIRAFAVREGMTEADLRLIGAGAERWQTEVPARPGALLHLLLPDDGGPALLTVVDPQP